MRNIFEEYWVIVKIVRRLSKRLEEKEDFSKRLKEEEIDETLAKLWSELCSYILG